MMKSPTWIQFKNGLKYSALAIVATFTLLACSSVENQAKNDRENPSLVLDDSSLSDANEIKDMDSKNVVEKEEAQPEVLAIQSQQGGRGKVMKTKALRKRIAQPMMMKMAAGASPQMSTSFMLPPQQDFIEPQVQGNTEEYNTLEENGFKSPLHDPLSTFSIDVDNASYSNVRRFLNQGRTLPEGSVRIEELINYFNYSYPQPKGEHPFSIVSEVATSPWNPENKLVHIGIQGKSLDYKNLKPSNLVFLLDVSGSMNQNNKLPLLKRSLSKLLTQLGPNDKVAIVAYAGAAGLVLNSTPASDRNTIMNALNRLQAGGSTAGGQGIQLAYDVALQNLISDGNNRVILATDGDFNVGTSSSADLVELIKSKRDQDIFLTICGFGMGNYKDGRMEEISNAGNGNYFYIDNDKEADKVFVREMRANMFTIAKDVKIQVEFNPEQVGSYRLIGYVNRKLNKEDFNDDKKDAGELGAGHTVTALYEVTPVGKNSSPSVDELKYQNSSSTRGAANGELMTVKFRYKDPKGSKSKLITTSIQNQSRSWEKTSPDFRFSAAVAAFGMKISNSKHMAMSWENIQTLSKGALDLDQGGDRSEFVNMVQLARNIYPERVSQVLEEPEVTEYDSRQVH